MTYEVKTERFSGPLDVLLNLIEAKKLAVSELSLASIVDEFIGYSRARDFSRSESAAFLAVASTLILIKSRALLPTLKLAPEEERSIEELEARLAALREFRRLSQHFAALAHHGGFYAREAFRGHEFGFHPPQKLTVDLFSRIASSVIKAFPEPPTLPERALLRTISIEERARDILDRIGERLSGSLASVVGGADAVETIVGFLAVLELMKQGLFEIKQKTPFGDVEVKRL